MTLPGGFTYTSGTATFTIVQAPPAITSALSTSRTFGSAIAAYTITGSNTPTGYSAIGLPPGLSVSTTTGAITGTPTAVGTYSVTIGASNAGGSGAATLTFTIAKASQTITFVAPAGKTFGDAAFAVSATSSSGLAPTYSIVGGGPATISGSTVTLTGAGTVTVRASQAGNANYNAAAVVDRSFTVAKATPTISVAPTATGITYGQTLASSTLTGTASVAGTFAFSTPGNLPNAGTAAQNVTFTPTASANYNIVATTVNVTVAKATLSVTADAKSRAYGEANPTLTATITGYVNSDTSSVVSGTAALTTTAATTSNVGGYTITAALGSLTATNYSFSFTAGTLTVSKAALTVTADAKSRTYGDANPTLTATITGYVNSDTSSVVSGTPVLSTGATATSNVGGYTITAALGSLTATNYSFSFTAGTLTVGTAALTVSADNQTKVYGAANPALTATITGFKNSETTAVLTGAPALSTAVTTASAVGDYAISATLGSLNPTNYSLSFTNGTLAVTKAPLTVTADPKSRAYGATEPTFTATLTGFVNSETLGTSGVSGTAAVTTTATLTSAAGTYPLTPALGGLTASNYAFTTFTNGTLTVGQTSQTITFGTLAGKTYGAAAFPVT